MQRPCCRRKKECEKKNSLRKSPMPIATKHTSWRSAVALPAPCRQHRCRQHAPPPLRPGSGGGSSKGRRRLEGLDADKLSDKTVRVSVPPRCNSGCVAMLRVWSARGCGVPAPTPGLTCAASQQTKARPWGDVPRTTRSRRQRSDVGTPAADVCDNHCGGQRVPPLLPPTTDREPGSLDQLRSSHR